MVGSKFLIMPEKNTPEIILPTILNTLKKITSKVISPILWKNLTRTNEKYLEETSCTPWHGKFL